MIEAFATLGADLAQSLPRAVVLLGTGCFVAHLLRLRTGWQHAILFTVLGAQVILALHAAFTPTFTWRILPAIAAPDGSPLPDAVAMLEGPATVLRGLEPLSSSAPGQWPISAVIGVVWLAGTVMLLSRIALGYLGLRRHHRPAAPASACSVALLEARIALRVHRPITLVIDHIVDQPYAFGILRPGIALPPTSEKWTRAEASAVLAHEVAHIARGDVAANLIGRCAAAVMWPNPLVHWVRRRTELLREHLADARAVSTGIAPADYVTSVISAIRTMVHAAPSAAVPLVRRRHDLERRMRAVLSPAGLRTGADAAHRAVAVLGTPLVGLASAVFAAGLPLIAAPPVCGYRDGQHLDVHRPTSAQRTEWLVQWSGNDCKVEWRATGTATIDPVRGRLSLPAVSDSVALTIHEGMSVRSMVAFRDPQGNTAYRVDNRSTEVGQAPEWLPGFLIELERHTAVARARRVPALLAEGGVSAVLLEARRMSGGHAAALYLTDLAAHQRLSAEQFVELLHIVSDAPVTNDAALEQLLLTAVHRAPMQQEAVGRGFIRAMNRLTAVAAMERVRAALTALTTHR